MTSDRVKFIATDMDGTLLDTNGELNPDFFDLFSEMESNDIIFAAASGRQYYSLIKTFGPVQDRMMFIAENGTMVMHQGNELYSCTMGNESIADIVNTARSIEGAHIVLCGKKSAYVETENPQALEEFAKYYAQCRYVENLLEVEDEFIKVAICHFDGAEKHIHSVVDPKFGHNHKVVVSAKIWLDVMSAVASKGAAIKHLQDSLGFTFEQTMSFGDYFNDIEMLQQSYHSYAVENAHEEVKKYARHIAPSNKDYGVLTVIRNYLESLNPID
ncbi:Cof-type HAD-IIB family hydrolase [Vibrio hannami]|uniref:Cof-type HAD-IIB family hydrolase n=1 Tax=Vibrio hannami TaxID=2717094 RepID=UPI0024102BC5|nr:Cof-type HAD-IIB family hydrolase [Vibrio hannami]MDG3085087.1 Cof-type HAD-IIB family hydrolase [Vibrio hannami]